MPCRQRDVGDGKYRHWNLVGKQIERITGWPVRRSEVTGHSCGSLCGRLQAYYKRGVESR